jgi:hypothetical protein
MACMACFLFARALSFDEKIRQSAASSEDHDQSSKQKIYGFEDRFIVKNGSLRMSTYKLFSEELGH